MLEINNDERSYIDYTEFLFKCMFMTCSKGERFRIRLWTDSQQHRRMDEYVCLNNLESIFNYILSSRTRDFIKMHVAPFCRKYWWVVDKVVMTDGEEIPLMRCTMTTRGRIISRFVEESFLRFYDDEGSINAYDLYQFLTQDVDKLPGPAKVDSSKFELGDIICLKESTGMPAYAVYLGELNKGLYRCIARRSANIALELTADYTLEELNRFEKVTKAPYAVFSQIRELLTVDPFYYYIWLLEDPNYKYTDLHKQVENDFMEKVIDRDLKNYRKGKYYFK